MIYANASTYAHRTEFYQSAIVTVDSPNQPAILDNMGLSAGYGLGCGSAGFQASLTTENYYAGTATFGMPVVLCMPKNE